MFGPVKLTKNDGIDKYKHSEYGLGFDARGTFLFPSGKFGQNVITFGVDMSFSAHINNKQKNISVLGKGPTQRLDGTTLKAEKSIQ